MCLPSGVMSNNTGIAFPLSSLYGLSRESLSFFQGGSSEDMATDVPLNVTCQLTLCDQTTKHGLTELLSAAVRLRHKPLPPTFPWTILSYPRLFNRSQCPSPRQRI